MSKKEMSNTKLVTPEIVCSYPNLAEPAAEEYGGKFALGIPFPKEMKDKLDEIIVNAAVNQWGEKARDLQGIKTFITDCDDDPKFDDDPVYKGKLKFSAKSKRRPGLVYPNMVQVPEENIEDVFYPGAIILAAIRAYGTETGGSRMIAFGLANVMFRRDGERIGGGSDPESDFGEYKDEDYMPDSGEAAGDLY